MTKTNNSTTEQSTEAVLTLTSPEIIAQTHKDMLHSTLFVSVLLNVIVFITWLVILVS